jgi:hypoxia up-regulated 1
VSEVPERSTHQFTRKEGEDWTNEELVAMQFAYAKELAEGVAGERVRDAVVTVRYSMQFPFNLIVLITNIAGTGIL